MDKRLNTIGGSAGDAVVQATLCSLCSLLFCMVVSTSVSVVMAKTRTSPRLGKQIHAGSAVDVQISSAHGAPPGGPLLNCGAQRCRSRLLCPVLAQSIRPPTHNVAEAGVSVMTAWV